MNELMAQRTLKTQLAISDGIASLGGMPFSGLVFDVDNDCEVVEVIFRDERLSCLRIRAIESYREGKLGGDYAPLDVELKYTNNSLLSFEEFPDCSHDYPATLEGGGKLSGVIYIPGQQYGWEARTYTAGTEDVKLWWHANFTLGLAVAGGLVHEEFRWYPDGSWKQCWIFNGGTFNAEFTPDGHLSFLILKDWKSALESRERKTFFKCLTELYDLFDYKSSTDIQLDFDDETARHVPEFLDSGIFDDTECIRWNGTNVNDQIGDLFFHLSEKKLKKVIFRSREEEVAEYCSRLRERIPKLEIVSVALNIRDTNK